LSPQLVTFNGSSFDLPVLRYRAMMHKVSAPGLLERPYFHRYAEDAVDLCDVLSWEISDIVEAVEAWEANHA